MISGRQALAQIEDAISSARDDEGRLDAALNSATERAAAARGEQMDAFRRLARIRLDDLASSKVGSHLDSAEADALELLAEKNRALADVAEKRRSTASAVGAGEAKRRDLAGRLEEIAGRITALTEKTKARVADAADWKGADAKVRDAEATRQRALDKTKQAESDRVTKGAPYEADRLFMYLWNAGWGTSSYSASFFVKFFDAKVARICRFDEARPNYATLIDIPVRLKGHADGLTEEVEAARAVRTAIERKALEADGIEALEAEFAQVKALVDAGNAELASAQNQLSTLDASHGALVSGDDPQLTAALDRVAQSLAAKDLQTLYADAFATPTPEDEKIVRRIDELGKEIASLGDEIARTREVIRQTAQRRSDLEQARDRGRTSGWDRPGWTFGNEQALGQVIGGIIGGIVTSPELWNVLLGGMRQRNSPTPSGGDWFGGGPRVPTGGGDWFGGGGSGGGGSSGGFGGDGGGFTTGGGFGGDGGRDTGGGF